MINKRAPLFGAIIVIFIIIIVASTINMVTTKEPKISNPEKVEQSIEEKTVKEEVEIEEEKVETTPQTKKTIPTPQVIEQPEEITEPSPTETSTEYIYNITSEEREMLAKLIFLEANTESLECQKAVVSVIINRLNSGYWGNTLHSVVYAKNQFTPASRIPYTTATTTNYEAVDYVLTNGVTLPSYCLYFRAGYHFSWNGYIPYTSIGNTYFGYMAKDKQ